MTERDYKKEPHPIWAKFMDGELDLATAFWGYLIGGTVIWCLANITLIVIELSAGEGPQYTVMAIGVFFLCNRTWASASKYIKEKNKKKQPAVWGILVQCVCFLNAMSMIVILYDQYFN